MAIRVGVIGAGNIVRAVHLPRLQTIRGVRLAAICDVNPQSLATAVSAFGGEAFGDHRGMLESAKLDAVLIAVRPADHGAVERDCAALGLPLFIEKPVAVRAADARRIAAVFRRAGTLTSVGYVFRYLDLIERLARFLEGRTVAQVNFRYHSALPNLPWWFNRAQSGGQTGEQVTHGFDLVRYLFGELKDVQARGFYGVHRKVKGYDIDDATLVTARAASGPLVSLAYSCVRKSGWTCEMEVLGGGFRAFWSFPDRALVLETDKREVIEQKNDPYLEELKAFFKAVRDGDADPVRSPYDDAVKTLALTESVNNLLSG